MALTDQPRKNMYLLMDEKYFLVMDRQLKTQGRQGGLIILKLRNLDTGAVLNETIKAGRKVMHIEPEIREMQYLYSDEADCYFMDTVTFDNITISKQRIGDYIQFLKEGDKALVMFDGENVLDIRQDTVVTLKVTESVDAVKGNTANVATKLVTLETGYRVNVPLFVKQDDMIIVNTESGEYTGRVSE